MLPNEASGCPAHTTTRRDRGPLVVSVVALLLSVFALVMVVADGACRPEPVPVADPLPPVAPPTDGQLRTSDPGEVRP